MEVYHDMETCLQNTETGNVFIEFIENQQCFERRIVWREKFIHKFVVCLYKYVLGTVQYFLKFFIFFFFFFFLTKVFYVFQLDVRERAISLLEI